MLNPWLWLGGLVLLITVAVGGYAKGHKDASNAAKAAYSKQLEATIAQAKENAVLDMQAAVEAETQRQQVRIEYRDRIVKIGESINANPSDCRIPDDRLGMLNAAIDAANTKTTTKPAKVPAATADTVKPR